MTKMVQMAATCEVGACGVAAIGRCLLCDDAFCATHHASRDTELTDLWKALKHVDLRPREAFPDEVFRWVPDLNTTIIHPNNLCRDCVQQRKSHAQHLIAAANARIAQISDERAQQLATIEDSIERVLRVAQSLDLSQTDDLDIARRIYPGIPPQVSLIEVSELSSDIVAEWFVDRATVICPDRIREVGRSEWFSSRYREERDNRFGRRLERMAGWPVKHTFILTDGRRWHFNEQIKYVFKPFKPSPGHLKRSELSNEDLAKMANLLGYPPV